jgi:hypothetical protein
MAYDNCSARAAQRLKEVLLIQHVCPIAIAMGENYVELAEVLLFAKGFREKLCGGT